MTQRLATLLAVVLLVAFSGSNLKTQAPVPTQLTQAETVYEELELQAEQGDAASSFELGVRYYLGNGVTLDHSEALQWLTLALEQGDTRAQGYLDTLYANNQGIPLDDITSVRSAAERGHVVSQFNLGVMYANGKNVIQDHAEAMKWYGLAADGGHLGAQYNLGVMHHNGNGTPKNDRAAVLLWHSAAEHGHVGAQYNLGAMYADGEGVAKNDVSAHVWFNIVASRSTGALRELAVENRELAAEQITPEQLIEAQRLAREWDAAHPRD